MDNLKKGDMSDLYGAHHIAIQKSFDTDRLAEAVMSNIVTEEILEDHKRFIESREMFFLTTIDHRGYPTCSYKGGHAGFVKVVDSKTLIFPNFDGNGMFLSMGNITKNPHIGLLFIDFETPHRIRVHGKASIHHEPAFINQFVEANMVVNIQITEVFINCTRYIHKYKKLESSRYVPQANCQTPLPNWKRIDNLQASLPKRDQHIAKSLGGTITTEEYVEMLIKGNA